MWEFPWIFGFVTFRLLLVFAFFCIFCGSQNFLRIRYFDSVLIGTVKMYFASSGLRSTGCFLIVYDAAFVSRIINIKGFSVWSLLVLFPFGRSAVYFNTMRISSPLLCIWLFVLSCAFRVLPVHWYHLFVSIRYHNFFHFSIWNII